MDTRPAFASLPPRRRFPRAAWLALAMLLVGALQAWLVLGPAEGRFRADIALAGLLKPLPPAEWWRLLTAPLLHGSVLHLTMNLMAFWALAQMLEQLGPRWWVGAVWLVGAVAGGLASTFWTVGPSIGASGGIVALMGFLWVLGWRWQLPGLHRGMLQAALLTLGLGLLLPDLIDNAAHGGGLLAGVLLGWLLVPDPRRPRGLSHARPLAWLVDVALALQVGWTCWWLLWPLRN